jgi:uncharacterized protein YndB with AHSA1/START domain
MINQLIALCLVFASVAAAQAPVKVTRVSTPEKALVFEADIPASLDDVWNAFTTSDGLSTWLTPKATVELRPGGGWTAHFPGGGSGGGTIQSFVPKQRIVMLAMAPPQFPHVREEGTTATWEFRAMDPKTTRVTMRQTGWKQGEEWDKAYEYLAQGNAQLLQTLQVRFVKGPIDWVKIFGPDAQK